VTGLRSEWGDPSSGDAFDYRISFRELEDACANVYGAAICLTFSPQSSSNRHSERLDERVAFRIEVGEPLPYDTWAEVYFKPLQDLLALSTDLGFGAQRPDRLEIADPLRLSGECGPSAPPMGCQWRTCRRTIKANPLASLLPQHSSFLLLIQRRGNGPNMDISAGEFLGSFRGGQVRLASGSPWRPPLTDVILGSMIWLLNWRSWRRATHLWGSRMASDTPSRRDGMRTSPPQLTGGRTNERTGAHSDFT
jgi:hypothetical protein